MNEKLIELLRKALETRSVQDTDLFYQMLFDNLFPKIYLMAWSRASSKGTLAKDQEAIADTECCEIGERLKRLEINLFPMSSDVDILQYALQEVSNYQAIN